MPSLDVYIPIAAVTQLEEQKNSQIDAALTELHEGSETEKLIQISNYISTHCTYDVSAQGNANEFWEEGKTSCAGYAFIFKHFAERPGISCDIVYGYVYGYTSTGAFHIWNRVRLSDGTYRIMMRLLTLALKINTSTYPTTPTRKLPLTSPFTNY